MKFLRLLTLLLAFGLSLAAGPRALAQGCVICKTETNSGEDARLTKYRGQGINTGILYLAAVPYLAASFLGYMWYRNRRKMRQQAAAQQG